jgi:hypothetical protein
MRAYASVNYKSFKQVTLNTMVELSRRVANNDFKKNYNVYESCSGSYCNPKNRRYVIDLDDCELNDDIVKYCIDVLNNVKPYNTEKVIVQLPTRSGVHLVTRAFDIETFKDIYNYKQEFAILDKPFYQCPDIKKNHLTLLYENL